MPRILLEGWKADSGALLQNESQLLNDSHDPDAGSSTTGWPRAHIQAASVRSRTVYKLHTAQRASHP